MFPDEDGERFCLMCGERTYDWLSTFLDRLLDAMERQALKEQFLVPSSEFRVPSSEGGDAEPGTRNSELGRNQELGTRN